MSDQKLTDRVRTIQDQKIFRNYAGGGLPDNNKTPKKSGRWFIYRFLERDLRSKKTIYGADL